MGLVNGTASFVRFSVEGELPEDTMSFISERVAAFSFQDIDDTVDEYSVGWVSVVNMFDSQFAYCSYLAGDYIVLSLRVDERKVSPSILKKFVAKEEERVKRERQVPKLSRTTKTEIKERLRSELTRKAFAVPSVYEIIWSLSENSVLFFTTNKKAHALLEDFFKDCFGLFLVQQIPYMTATQLVSEQDLSRLETLSAEILV